MLKEIRLKEAVNLEKFQKLAKEISALVKNLKKVSIPPAKQLETVLKIAKNYPLQENEEREEHREITKNEKFIPEIIISESFK